MKATSEELVSILDAVTKQLGEILATTVEITETRNTDDYQKQLMKSNVAKLKTKMEKAKEDLEKHKLVSSRKKELAAANRENKKNSSNQIKETTYKPYRLTIRINSQVIGREQGDGKGNADFYGPTGKLVAKERGGKTYTAKGTQVSQQKVGLALLGADWFQRILKQYDVRIMTK